MAGKFCAIILVAPRKFVEIASVGDIDRIKSGYQFLTKEGFIEMQSVGIFDRLEQIRRRLGDSNMTIGNVFSNGYLTDREKAIIIEAVMGSSEMPSEQLNAISFFDFRLERQFNQLRKEIARIDRVLDEDKILEDGDEVLIRPLITTLCVSESYYYYGQKSIEKIISRLPSVLLHEGVAEVVKVPPGCNVLSPTQKVVVDPLKTDCDFSPRDAKCWACQHGERSLCERTTFMGSTGNGLACSYILHSASSLYPVSLRDISLEILALAEPLATCYRAYRTSRLHKEFPIKRKVAVIGTGPIGYMLAAILAYIAKVPKDQLFYIGRTKSKLAKAAEFATLVHSDDLNPEEPFKGKDFLYRRENRMDVVFECAGGTGMERTINTAIKILVPGGICYTLGLSDSAVPTNWIDVVNKGLTFQGVSRARRADFTRVLRQLSADRDLRQVLAGAVMEPIVVRNAAELTRAFEDAFPDSNNPDAKKPSKRVAVRLEI